MSQKRPEQDSDVVFMHPSHLSGATCPVHTPVSMDQIAPYIMARVAAPAATAEPAWTDPPPERSVRGVASRDAPWCCW
jgi:hypothetical protein